MRLSIWQNLNSLDFREIGTKNYRPRPSPSICLSVNTQVPWGRVGRGRLGEMSHGSLHLMDTVYRQTGLQQQCAHHLKDLNLDHIRPKYYRN